MRSLSPLRYPGGKASLAAFIEETIHEVHNDCYHYVEPYAGGAGVALYLLEKKVVKKIWINDLDENIYCFWWAVLNAVEEVTEFIATTKIDVETWDFHKKRLTQENLSIIDRANSTFFLNRTSRSGVISGAGIIGGRNQSGNYLIDCRFNREALSKRIFSISKKRKQIKLTNIDGGEVVRLSNKLKRNTFIYLDPPYFAMGGRLYKNSFSPQDHETLSCSIKDSNHPWLVTYDDVPEIRELYAEHKITEKELLYSLQTKRSAFELVIEPKHIHHYPR
jgi:DNA adenine methylase